MVKGWRALAFLSSPGEQAAIRGQPSKRLPSRAQRSGERDTQRIPPPIVLCYLSYRLNWPTNLLDSSQRCGESARRKSRRLSSETSPCCSEEI